MARLLLIFGAALLVLAACAPSQPTPTGESPAVLPASPAPTTAAPEPTGMLAPTEPAPAWRADPQAKIVTATYCCGLVPVHVKTNYIPAAQIWGDGRIIWTQFDPAGRRQVLVGRLSSERVAALLDGVVAEGFFEWQERYIAPNSPTDLPSKCLTIQVENRTKRVCEYFEGAPQAFHDFFDVIASGAGVTGEPYVPERAYLTAEQRGQAAASAEILDWDDGALGVSLDQASQGMWLEQGPALARAWDVVNASAWQPLVKQGEDIYLLVLQVPGVSMTEPPEP